MFRFYDRSRRAVLGQFATTAGAMMLGMMLVGVMLVVGCSGKQQAEVAMRRDCLSRLGVVYHQFHTAKKRSPSGVDEFATYVVESAKADDPVASELDKRLRDADIVVFWDAVLSDDGQSDADHILAFEASCPGNGGYMVTVGQRVDHVTAKKFDEMTKVEHPEQP